jgi:F-type H+-transporting ATPase subunit epsilon
MKLTVAKIDQMIYKGDFDSVVVPGSTGELEIMPGHSPLLSSLKKGMLTYRVDGKDSSLEIEKGFVEVNKNEVIIVL